MHSEAHRDDAGTVKIERTETTYEAELTPAQAAHRLLQLQTKKRPLERQMGAIEKEEEALAPHLCEIAEEQIEAYQGEIERRKEVGSANTDQLEEHIERWKAVHAYCGGDEADREVARKCGRQNKDDPDVMNRHRIQLPGDALSL